MNRLCLSLLAAQLSHSVLALPIPDNSTTVANKLESSDDSPIEKQACDSLPLSDAHAEDYYFEGPPPAFDASLSKETDFGPEGYYEHAGPWFVDPNFGPFYEDSLAFGPHGSAKRDAEAAPGWRWGTAGREDSYYPFSNWKRDADASAEAAPGWHWGTAGRYSRYYPYSSWKRNAEASADASADANAEANAEASPGWRWGTAGRQESYYPYSSWKRDAEASAEAAPGWRWGTAGRQESYYPYSGWKRDADASAEAAPGWRWGTAGRYSRYYPYSSWKRESESSEPSA